MINIVITAIEQDTDPDGLIVYGTVDEVPVQAHAWRSHLYADHAEHDAARTASQWRDEHDEPVEPTLLPVEDRLDTDEKRTAHLKQLLAEQAQVATASDLAHLVG
jgi:hypothetical protein